MKRSGITNDPTEILEENFGKLREKRKQIAVTENTQLVDIYWNIGKYIVEFEQKGARKAQYGSALINTLAKDLISKGF